MISYRGLLALFVALCVMCAVAAWAAPGKGDILTVASGAKNFSTFVKAVKAAGIADTLKGAGPFTVFAPTDAAFKKLPAGTLDTLLKPENRQQLKAILLAHVVKGRCSSAQIVKKKSSVTLTSLQGPSIRVMPMGKKVMVEKATVVKPDLQASNGLIQGIDQVIMPGADTTKPAEQPKPKRGG